MQIQGVRMEIQALKNELTPDIRPLDALLRMKAGDMTTAEIDMLASEVPVEKLPTYVIVSLIDRDLDEINEYLGTSFKSIAGVPNDLFKKMMEHFENEPATIEK